LVLPIVETLSELTDDPDVKKTVLLMNETGPEQILESSPISSDNIETHIEWSEERDAFIEPEDDDDDV